MYKHISLLLKYIYIRENGKYLALLKSDKNQNVLKPDVTTLNKMSQVFILIITQTS